MQAQGIDSAHLAPLFFSPLVRALLDVCRDDQGRARLHLIDMRDAVS